jgi:hypothetical protein
VKSYVDDLKSSEKLLNAALWVVQCYLAVRVGWAGYQQALWTPERMVLEGGMYFAFEVPLPVLRIIGLAELAGAIGLIVPSLVRIAPLVTPLAAGGVILLQFMAIFFNITHEVFYQFLPEHLGVLLPALFVAFGREEVLPIPSRLSMMSRG